MLNLRGTLRVECGQTVLECLVSDKKAPAPRASTDALLTHVALPSLFDPTWRAAQVLEALLITTHYYSLLLITTHYY